MEPTPESVWAYLQEVGKRLDQIGEEIKELRESLREQGRETDRRLREESERTEEKIRELANLFTTQWGKLVEALVEPGAVNLFRERGIKVRRSARRIEVEDEQGRKIAEYDIFLENDEEVVIIEVKTTVKKEDVDEFLEKLRGFKDLNPKYRDYRVYGAVAGITFEEGVDRYAYRQGLFVLRSEGGIIRIANNPNFKPRIW